MPLKILLLRFSSIGDIVLTTPVIRCIKQQVKDAELHYATKKQYESLLSSNPYIDKLHLLEEKKLAPLMDQLDVEKFDLIIDLHHNLRTFLIKNNLHRESRSFNKINFQKWLLVQFKINRLPEKHIVERYLETVKPLGVINDGKGLDFFVPSHDEVSISQLPPSHQNGFIAIVIGALHNTKKLPASRLAELCHIVKRPVVLIGGPDDKDLGDEIIFMNSGQVFNACGMHNINQSASLIRQAEKVFAHDTGMMHIAAALGKDLYSIWGNTIPEFGMYPWHGINDLSEQRRNGRILEVQNLSCRPCSKLGFETCPKGHFKCMNDIRFDSIQQI